MAAANSNYVLEIEDVSMIIRKCKLTDASYAQLINTPALYPITRVLMKDYSYASGIRSISMNNVTSGILPQRIVLAMVSNAALNGVVNQNPFNFQHFGLVECNVAVNGSTVNGKPLSFDFESSKDCDGYWSLFASSGKMHHNIGSVINRKDYKDGYTIIAIDLSPSLCDSEYIDPDRSGDLSIGLSFEKNLASSVTVLVYCEYNSLVEVTSGRKVIPHFQV